MELEVRAWDSKENRMEYCPGVKRMEDWLSPDINGLIKHCQDDEGYILLLYIGLKDKNGKKIYEGDIIRYGYVTATGYRNNKEMIIGVVEWADNRCAFVLRELQGDREDERYILFCEFEIDAEVFGNIYENPELLKEAK